ncbi:MAG: ATP-grasp domain-containing protein [Candidatus Omnitrophica bacterium]|nr:ATP-grasp domain-containing protein [Candidatus Omnitrophota bacterium]
MSKSKTIGLTYDLRREYVFKKSDPPDANAEFDHHLTIGIIEKALVKIGHKVVRIGNVQSLLEKLSSLKVDIVFNIAEGISGRNRESQVPVILETKNIPFVGSDGLTMGLTLDKFLTKKILITERIPTPAFMEIKDVAELNGFKLNFPLIVKPRYEGSSKGISKDSLTRNIKSMKERADWVIKTYKQPALVEEFIRGQEFTILVLGNKKPEALPPVQISIRGKTELGDMFYTFGHIRSRALKYICPPKISRDLRKKIEEVAVKAYKALECADFGRVDIRVDEKGTPFVLEINPLPSLSSDDVFPLIGGQLGIGYEGILKRILNCAFERYGIN